MILSTIVSTAAPHHYHRNSNINNINHDRGNDHNDRRLCRKQELCTETSSSKSIARWTRPSMRHTSRTNLIKKQLGANARSGSGAIQSRTLLVVAAAASLLLMANLALAFPSGAPEQACKDLKPGHGAEPQSSSSPFELTQDKLQVEAGDQIKGKYEQEFASLSFCLKTLPLSQTRAR